MSSTFLMAAILMLVVFIGLPAFIYWWVQRPERLPRLGERAGKYRSAFAFAGACVFALLSAGFATFALVTGYAPALSRHNWYVDQATMPLFFWFTVAVWVAAAAFFAICAWAWARIP